MDLVIEIGTEELPAKVVTPALSYLKERFSEITGRKDVEVYGTPRRLTVYIRNFENRKERSEDIIYGPPWKVSFDDEGRPTRALLGFLRKHGSSLDQVFKARKNGGEYAAIKLVKEETTLLDRIKENFQDMLLSIPFPKRMRWTSSKEITFSRPVRWLLALHGDRVVDLSFGDLKAGRVTYGHRFLSPEPVEVERAEDYLRVLRERMVIPDVEERKRMIEDEIVRIAGSLGGKPDYPEGLVDEVANLVEYPFPVLGAFDERYLDLPDRVIVTVAAHHQRFFCISKNGRITNHFIGISNNRPEGGTVKEGYERVLKARLEDALFFYREDLKRRLDDLVPDLSGVLIHPKIGSFLDKVNRIKRAVSFLAEKLNLSEEATSKALRAAHLSKADLLTEMVKEFDELQGYMGYIYALKQGEDEEVALALWDQYKPSGPGDDTPRTLTGALLSVADKLDDLITFFSAGEIPKGSSDPYGLRRAAFGVFRILEERDWEVDIREVAELYNKVENLEDLESFLAQRLESYLGDQNLVRAVTSVRSALEPLGVIRRVRELLRYRGSEVLADVYEAYRRVVKILPKGWEKREVEESLFREKEEADLWERVREKEAKDRISLEDLASLKPYIDNLFEKVLIMDEDLKVRENRIALLLRTKEVFNRIADFSLVVV